jgi:hypothetical protein
MGFRTTFNQKLIVLAFASAFIAFTVNKINLKLINNHYGIEWLSNDKIKTTDDASYLRPADNFIESGIWKDNSLGNSSYYQRTPGYGILYLVFKIFFNNNAIGFLVFFQTFLYGIGVYLFGKLIFILTDNQNLSIVSQIIYGFLPASYGFIFYNITEGITPFLMILFMYISVITIKKGFKISNLVFISFLFLFILLVRPQLLPFSFVYPVTLLYYYGFNKPIVFSIMFFLTISFLGISLWFVRGYQISHEFIGLLPIYSRTNNSQYRPTHKALGELYKVWEYQPQNLHSALVPIWNNSIKGKLLKKDIDNAVNRIPIKVFKYISKNNWENLFKDYQKTIFQQKKYYDLQQKMPNEILKSEEAFILKVKNYENDLKKEMKLDYYLLTPIKSYKKTAIHSNLNLQIFQSIYRGNFLIEILRWFSLIIFSGSVFISLWLWMFRIDILIRLISFSIFSYTFYLIFFQRMNETRYMSPIFPIALILTIYFINKIKKTIYFNSKWFY